MNYDNNFAAQNSQELSNLENINNRSGSDVIIDFSGEDYSTDIQEEEEHNKLIPQRSKNVLNAIQSTNLSQEYDSIVRNSIQSMQSLTQLRQLQQERTRELDQHERSSLRQQQQQQDIQALVQSNSQNNDNNLNDSNSVRTILSGNTEDDRKKRRLLEIKFQVFWFVIVIMSTPINCGIPVKSWLIFQFIVQFMQVTNQMYMEILEANPHRYPQWLKYRKVAKPVALISIELLYIASLIQGNMYYYSSENTCQKDNTLLMYLMFYSLLIGYLHFMLYTLLACVLLAFLVLKRKNQERQENTVFKILKNLTKTKISEIFLTEEECVICWNKYEEDAEIVKLTCNEKHYFHAQCIEDWIKGGKNTCPLCRQPIDKDVAV